MDDHPSAGDLLEGLKQHIVRTMEYMPECAPAVGKGAGYSVIEQMAELDLGLSGQNSWLTYSLLLAMNNEGRVQIVPGTESRRKWRLP